MRVAGIPNEVDMTATETLPIAKPKDVRPDYRHPSILRWSYEEAADCSGLQVSSLYVFKTRGKFKTYRHGRWRVDRVSFERYLAERT